MKILVVEANGYAGAALLQAAQELGAYVIVATHADLRDNYPEELVDRIDEFVFVDFADTKAAVEELVRFGEGKGLAAVVTAWEFLSPVATKVAAGLGLPSNDPELAESCRNKVEMASAFQRGNVPAPPLVQIVEPEQAADEVDRDQPYPIVVKPADNAGSIGVSIVDGPESLAAAVDKAREYAYEFPHNIPLDRRVILQEFVAGDEFSVETIVSRGQAYHLGVTKKLTTSGSSRAELGHTVPAELAADVHARIAAAASAAVAALGVKNGIAHTEIILDEGGAPHVIETGARPPGDNIMSLVFDALGIDEAKEYIRAAAGLEVSPQPKKSQVAAIRFIVPPKAGVVRSIVAPELPRAEGVVRAEITGKQGDKVGGPTDNLGRVGFVAVVGATHDEVEELARRTLDSINVDVVDN